MRDLRSTFQYLSRAHKTLTKTVNSTRGLSSTAPSQESAPPLPPPPPASAKVTSIVEEISGLTLLEVADLTEVLRNKLDIKEMPIMAVMMPGMGFSTGIRGGRPGSGGAKGGGVAEAAKEEKTVFDVKLEGYEAAGKIKVIKEVRGFTDLGLKEAKELVEKAPTLLKKGVTKEEAEKIIEKMKEVGAKVVME